MRYGFTAEDWQETDPQEAMVSDYATFRAFAEGVAGELKRLVSPEGSRHERLFETFETALGQTELKRATAKAKAFVILSRVEDSDVGVVHTRDVADDCRQILAKRPVLAAALTTLLRAVTQENPDVEDRRLLLALDEFEVVPPGSLRTWIVELFSDLESALVLLPRTPNLDPPDVPRMVNCELARLTRQDIRELAQKCLPAREISDQLIDAIEDATDGHPQSVCLAVELLQRQEGADVAAFVDDLGALPGDLAKRHRVMIDKILGRDGREARATVQACAVMRKFDAPMLKAVVGPDLDPEELERRYSFVERTPDPRRGFFRIHPVIQNDLSRRLKTDDQERFLDLHRRAAAFCATWISAFEENQEQDPESLSYGSWYRYEDPTWQAGKREWLYHQVRATKSGDDERKRGRARFARVFFDAFWWWGCYLEFPFCRMLVKDWLRTQKDRAWTDALTVILDAYPGGYEKDKAPHEWRDGAGPRWQVVRRALLDVSKECSLDGDASELQDEEQRHTRGLIENFLAHTFRYEGADEAAYASALAPYNQAVELFEHEDQDGNWDKWDTAWTRFERGELHREHGRTDPAREDWKRAADLVVELAETPDEDEQYVDEELAANLHRLAADAHAGARDFDAAFAAHGRAVLHAYLFQGRPHPPDEYTRAFYEEQIARALDRLLEHAQDGGDLRSAAERLVAPFPGGAAPGADELAELAAKRDHEGLAAALFPERPAEGELNLGRDTTFAQRWLLAETEIALPAPTDLPDSGW